MLNLEKVPMLASRRFGHNVASLYAEAETKGIGALVTLRADDRTLLKTATPWYLSKKLQYFDLYEAGKWYAGAPDLPSLEDFANRLQSDTLRQALLLV